MRQVHRIYVNCLLSGYYGVCRVDWGNSGSTSGTQLEMRLFLDNDDDDTDN